MPATWSLLPAAVNERDAAVDLLAHARHVGVLGDRGFAGRAVSQALAAETVTLLTPSPGRSEDRFKQLKDRVRLDQQRAPTVWGLLTRLAAKLAAFTRFTAWRRRGLPLE